MKRVLSLATMLVALSYASPASAEVKLGGDVSVRLREVSNNTANKKAYDNLSSAYRLRLNAAADLEGGYIFRALISNEAPNGLGGV